MPRQVVAHIGRWVALILLSGCGGTDGTPPTFDDDPITVAPISQWGGGAVRLASSTFAKISADSATVTLDSFTVHAHRVDATHFSFILPPRATGGVKAIEVQISGVTGGAEVTVAGLVESDLIPQFLVDIAPQPWPWDHPTGLLGKTNDLVPVYVDARTGQTWAFPTIRAFGAYVPGTSYRPGIAAVYDSAGLALYSLDVVSGGATLDTLIGGSFTRQAYELSPGRILYTGSHFTPLVVDDSLQLFQTESPWYLIRSPDGAKATFIVSWSRWNGVEQLPVVELATQRVTHTVLGVGVTDAAAWSIDGGSLYVAAHSTPSQPQGLVRADPATGNVITAITPGTENWTWWLAVDPTHGWLFDLAGQGDWFQLRIRDPETLEILGAPEFPVPANYTGSSFPLLIPDPGNDRIHVIYETPTGVKIQHISMP